MQVGDCFVRLKWSCGLDIVFLDYSLCFAREKSTVDFVPVASSIAQFIFQDENDVCIPLESYL